MRRGRWLEVMTVALLLAVLVGAWLTPASGALVHGPNDVYLGDGSDSVTNPWQYQVVLDAAREAPLSLLRGALYSDQASAPAGQALFIPWSERLLCLMLAPFVNTTQMVTAVVWAYLVAAGVAMHACGRVLGWSRITSLALAVAWSLCPYTRARAVCHVALVSVYFAPCVVLGLALLAGRGPAENWTTRRRILVAATLLVAAVGSAHYYVMLLALFAPLLALMYIGLSDASSWRRRLVPLGLAGLPAGLLLVWMSLFALPAEDARRVAEEAPVAERVRQEQRLYLSFFGAKPMDYLAGDVDFGTRDAIGLRSAITEDVRSSVTGNYHERTNGIRWSILALASLAPLIVVRRSSCGTVPGRRSFVLGALALGIVAFLASLGAKALVLGGIDLGPAAAMNALVPGFRVANRAGVLVHFAALLLAGTTLGWLEARAHVAWQRAAVAGVVLLLVVVEYLPLHALPTRHGEPAREALRTGSGCGTGVTVPYVTFGFHDDAYFAAFTSLRGTSCKLLHAGYLTNADDALRARLSSDSFDEEAVVRAVAFARCAGTSWAIFPAHVPSAYRRQFCAAMNWSSVSDDACRGPVVPPTELPFTTCLP